jgi:hypothetical protein
MNLLQFGGGAGAVVDMVVCASPHSTNVLPSHEKRGAHDGGHMVGQEAYSTCIM